jgi:death on curing protein
LPSGKRHYRITLQDALEANRIALTFGGLAGVKREADVLSAIGRPYSGYYRSISRKAAALFESVATNHGFNDGNKRSAILLVTLLLVTLLVERSGYRLQPATTTEDMGEALEQLALHVVNDHPPFDEVVNWFSQRIRR